MRVEAEGKMAVAFDRAMRGDSATTHFITAHFITAIS